MGERNQRVGDTPGAGADFFETALSSEARALREPISAHVRVPGGNFTKPKHLFHCTPLIRW